MSQFIEHQQAELGRHLRKHISGEVRLDRATCLLYATDASIYQIEPLGVVLPRSTEDVVACVQIAAESRVPLIARGGGTSLSGQSIGHGLVLDFTKYMNQIRDIDAADHSALIQPGVVLDTLNQAVAPFDLQFGPDVSTSSRASLGGMIGNNSAGARSIVYGKTVDHVREMDVVLASGRRATFGPVTAAEWEKRSRSGAPEGELYRQVGNLVRLHEEEIQARFPKILRRVSGYNLPELLPLLDGKPAGLQQLLVGSEGTLACMTGARVNLVERPSQRGLLVPQFDTLAHAMQAVAVCLEMNPSAVELMDHLLLQLTAGNLSLRETTRIVDHRTQALFMVEFSSNDPAEVLDQIEKLSVKLSRMPGLITATRAVDPAIRDPLWNLRRASMPLLYSMPGDRKPITFVEDTAVSPEVLPEFVERFRAILRSHGTDGAFYGHASVGCLHIRPVMNLKDAAEVRTMRAMTEEVADLVLEYGGSLSGEHGDGLARSEWNRKMFGDVIYEVFCSIKAVFDPQNLLNPGKIVHAPPMTENLRYPPGYAPAEPKTVFDYSRQEGFLRSVEMCNGSGACRKRTGGAMCPSYRATLDEKDSTRGRANALRHALIDGGKSLKERWLLDIFDLCLMCKACKSECPSNVDVGKMKAEFLQGYYQGKPRPLDHLLLAGLPWLNRLAAPLAPLVNWVQKWHPSRWLLERLGGIDRRRSLPSLHRNHLRRWFRKHQPDTHAGQRGTVLLLADCFTTYNEPHVGQAAVRVLERAGYKVELLDLFCCGRVLISKGFLQQARSWVQECAERLAQRVEGGTKILGLEPSCLLTLVDEWPDLVPGKATSLIARNAKLADQWLAGEVKAGNSTLPLIAGTGHYLVHGHCHQKALLGNGASAASVNLVPGLGVHLLDAGCCGMAGSFGYECSHYDLSVKMANLALVPALNEAPNATVVASGTSCRHQIRDLTGRTARHPLEILAGQLSPD